MGPVLPLRACSTSLHVVSPKRCACCLVAGAATPLDFALRNRPTCLPQSLRAACTLSEPCRRAGKLSHDCQGSRSQFDRSSLAPPRRNCTQRAASRTARTGRVSAHVLTNIPVSRPPRPGPRRSRRAEGASACRNASKAAARHGWCPKQVRGQRRESRLCSAHLATSCHPLSAHPGMVDASQRSAG